MSKEILIIVNVVLAASMTFDIFAFIKIFKLFGKQYRAIHEMLPSRTNDQDIENTVELVSLLILVFSIGAAFGVLFVAALFVAVILLFF